MFALIQGPNIILILPISFKVCVTYYAFCILVPKHSKTLFQAINRMAVEINYFSLIISRFKKKHRIDISIYQIYGRFLVTSLSLFLFYFNKVISSSTFYFL